MITEKQYNDFRYVKYDDENSIEGVIQKLQDKVEKLEERECICK